MKFDHAIYFDSVRTSLFTKLTQQQVDGQNAILAEWEKYAHEDSDIRWLAYGLATAYHETSQTMWPIEEYGKGKGMKYGTPDPETGKTYYGRGFVQLTWRDNYEYATEQLRLIDDNDLVWHPEKALDLQIATDIMFLGMRDGWFRSPNKLATYFNDTTEDAYGAREIINGDKKTVPSWSNGVSIGNLIKGYYSKFNAALYAAYISVPEPTPEPEPEPEPEEEIVTINITAPEGITVKVVLNGDDYAITT